MDQVEHWANQDEVAPAIPVGVLVKFQTGSIFSSTDAHMLEEESKPT